MKTTAKLHNVIDSIARSLYEETDYIMHLAFYGSARKGLFFKNMETAVILDDLSEWRDYIVDPLRFEIIHVSTSEMRRACAHGRRKCSYSVSRSEHFASVILAMSLKNEPDTTLMFPFTLRYWTSRHTWLIRTHETAAIHSVYLPTPPTVIPPRKWEAIPFWGPSN